MNPLCTSPEPQLGIVRVTGGDARDFLHAQTTQVVAALPGFAWRRAAWLNAKGRIRALFDLVADADGFWLVLPADACETFVRQLGRFVLRADVTLTVAADRRLHTVCGEADDWLAAQGIALDAGTVAGAAGALWYRSAARRIDVIAAAEPPAPLAGLPACPAGAAERAAIAAGLPCVPAALSERYIPQMLNLDRLEAVSFTKGCYPGQEIVARTTNLGQVKRRLQRYTAPPGPRPLLRAEIVTARGEPAGEVHRVAADDARFGLLAVVALDAADGPLLLAEDGRRLEPEPLPYAL